MHAALRDGRRQARQVQHPRRRAEARGLHAHAAIADGNHLAAFELLHPQAGIAPGRRGGRQQHIHCRRGRAVGQQLRPEHAQAIDADLGRRGAQPAQGELHAVAGPHQGRRRRDAQRCPDGQRPAENLYAAAVVVQRDGVVARRDRAERQRGADAAICGRVEHPRLQQHRTRRTHAEPIAARGRWHRAQAQRGLRCRQGRRHRDLRQHRACHQQQQQDQQAACEAFAGVVWKYGMHARRSGADGSSSTQDGWARRKRTRGSKRVLRRRGLRARVCRRRC